MRMIKRFAIRLARDRRAVAGVEFALNSIVFLIILAGTIDVGNMIFSAYQLDATVSAGAQYAVVSGSSVNSTSGATLANSISAIVNNGHGSGGGWSNTVVVNNGPTTATADGSASSSGTPVNADSCYCPSGTPGSWSWGGSQTCGASCAGGGIAGKFVSITATRTFTPFFPAWAIISSNSLTRTAMVQVQ